MSRKNGHDVATRTNAVSAHSSPRYESTLIFVTVLGLVGGAPARAGGETPHVRRFIGGERVPRFS